MLHNVKYYPRKLINNIIFVFVSFQDFLSKSETYNSEVDLDNMIYDEGNERNVKSEYVSVWVDDISKFIYIFLFFHLIYLLTVESKSYSIKCRCNGFYIIGEDDLENNLNITQCTNC